MATDPESEMLLSENTSNAVVSENGSVSAYIPQWNALYC